MKKALLISSICFICLSINGQNDRTVKFTFPIKPGDAAWSQLDSPISRIMSMQIPDSILCEIPTDELLNVCLDYPYIIDLVFLDNYQKGVESIICEFNGFKELLRREDVATVLENKLNDLPVAINSIQRKTDLEKGIFSFKCFFLELLIAQDTVLSKMDEEQVKSVHNILFCNSELKKAETEIFGEINEVSSSLILAKLALRNLSFEITNKQREELTRFVAAPLHLSPSISECLTNYKKSIIL